MVYSTVSRLRRGSPPKNIIRGDELLLYFHHDANFMTAARAVSLLIIPPLPECVGGVKQYLHLRLQLSDILSHILEMSIQPIPGEYDSGFVGISVL
jgi:hypothetical protein